MNVSPFRTKDPPGALLAGPAGRRSPGVVDPFPAGGRTSNSSKGGFLWFGSSLLVWLILVVLLLWGGLEAAPESFSFLFPVDMSYRTRTHPVNGEEQRIAIAVSTLANKSKDKRLDPLIEAVTRGIIASLSRRPRLSAFRWFSPGPLREDLAHDGLARVSESRYALTGSVFVAGKISQIGIRLVDLQTEAEVWTGSYECPTRSLLDMQDVIAEEIARGLDAWLRGLERRT
jgi:TolB-like protein